jgi:antitoxin component of MazEF toxin-antitoxin module
MSQNIRKWGNSLAFRIPAAIVRQMGLNAGARVEFRIDGKRLVVEKADEMPAFTPEDLQKALRTIKKDLIDPGGPQGKEIL